MTDIIESSATAHAHSNRLVATALANIDLNGATTRRDFAIGLEPLALAVFEASAGGQCIATDPIVGDLGLDHPQNDWASAILSTAAEDGWARAAILADLLVLSPDAVSAAAGALQWERWRALHDDDFSAGANAGSVEEVAREIARRAPALIGVPLSPEEAAWAAIEGARRVGLELDRSAWRYAYEGALRGEASRLRGLE